MTEKVKIPQNVADTYAGLEISWNLTEIFRAVTADFKVRDSRIEILVEWNESGRNDEGAGLMQLLLGKYEIEPEYKVGDWVTRIKSRGIIAHPSDTAGVAFEVSAVDGVKVAGSDNRYSHHARGLRYATPEEIQAEKERQKWVGIEPGDVLRFLLMAHEIAIYQGDADDDYIIVKNSVGQYQWRKTQVELYAKKVGASNA